MHNTDTSRRCVINTPMVSQHMRSLYVFMSIQWVMSIYFCTDEHKILCRSTRTILSMVNIALLQSSMLRVVIVRY